MIRHRVPTNLHSLHTVTSKLDLETADFTVVHGLLSTYRAAEHVILTDQSLSNISGLVSLTAGLILPDQAELIRFKLKSTNIVITFVFFSF